MAPAALYSHGLSKPPKTRFRRLLWAIAVFVLSGAILPFVIVGIFQESAAGRIGGTVALIVVLLPLLCGVAASVYGFVSAVRSRPLDADESSTARLR